MGDRCILRKIISSVSKGLEKNHRRIREEMRTPRLWRGWLISARGQAQCDFLWVLIVTSLPRSLSLSTEPLARLWSSVEHVLPVPHRQTYF